MGFAFGSTQPTRTIVGAATAVGHLVIFGEDLYTAHTKIKSPDVELKSVSEVKGILSKVGRPLSEATINVATRARKMYPYVRRPMVNLRRMEERKEEESDNENE